MIVYCSTVPHLHHYGRYLCIYIKNRDKHKELLMGDEPSAYSRRSIVKRINHPPDENGNRAIEISTDISPAKSVTFHNPRSRDLVVTNDTGGVITVSSTSHGPYERTIIDGVRREEAMVNYLTKPSQPTPCFSSRTPVSDVVYTSRAAITAVRDPMESKLREGELIAKTFDRVYSCAVRANKEGQSVAQQELEPGKYTLAPDPTVVLSSNGKAALIQDTLNQNTALLKMIHRELEVARKHIREVEETALALQKGVSTEYYPNLPYNREETE